MANENNDKIYGILRDVKNNVVTVEDGFARISGLQDASELDEKSFKDDQKTELVDTTPEDIQTQYAVQAVAEVPEDQPEQPDTSEVIFEDGEEERIENASKDASSNERGQAKEVEESEEKPKSRRKKKTAEDDTEESTK